MSKSVRIALLGLLPLSAAALVSFVANGLALAPEAFAPRFPLR